MQSNRYGNLARIAAKTGGRCHLCHEPVDLAFYGRTGFYGDDTVTVDHLVPQVFGGTDDEENLLIAHGHCNSRRGLDLVEDVRRMLAGTSRAPMSEGEQVATAVVVGSVSAFAAGHAFAHTDPDGTRRFNGRAAAGFGILAGLITLAATQ